MIDTVAGAHLFHHFAADDLGTLGFQIVNDPTVLVGNFLESSALYGSESGLHVSVGFSPIDSKSATIMFGRQWEWEGFARGLSNYLFAFARKYSLDLPQTYPLVKDAVEVRATNQLIVSDLQRTLPPILARLVLADLWQIEFERYGRARMARRRFGDGYLEHVTMSVVRW